MLWHVYHERKDYPNLAGEFKVNVRGGIRDGHPANP